MPNATGTIRAYSNPTSPLLFPVAVLLHEYAIARLAAAVGKGSESSRVSFHQHAHSICQAALCMSPSPYGLLSCWLTVLFVHFAACDSLQC